MATGWMRPMGRALRGIRAGMHGLACHRPWLRGAPECLRVSSPAFGHGSDIPARFSADGPALSPPLAWEGVPAGAASLVLLVEDPDIPFPVPLVHLIVYDIPISLSALAEGAVPNVMKQASTEGWRTGRNSFGRPGWLAPTPPPGHGPHHYAFQMFALARAPSFEQPPGRHALLQQMRGQVLGWGVGFGIYERV